MSILLLVIFVSPIAKADDRADGWRSDLASLAAELERVHPKFQRCGPTPEIREAFAHVQERIASLSDPEIVVETQKLLARAGDGHTLLWPFGMKRGVLLQIPVQLWQFDDGLSVVRAEQTRLVGHRVVKIGTLATNELLDRLAEFVSHDNEMQLRWAAPLYATFTDFLVATGAITDRNSATLTLEDGEVVRLAASPVDPEKLETKLVPPATGPVPAYLAHRGAMFRSEALADGTLYVQVNGINDEKDQTLAAFATSLRPLLAKTDRMILDLRLNNGGEASKANELLKTLIAFDTRGGHIAVLTSRMTFSAAQTLCTRLDEWTGAMFVGEATGSRPNHFGNERPFKLANSGVRGTISSGLNQPVSARDDRTSIVPEIAVPMIASDYFRGDDPVLAAALKALQQRER